jgi:hypothetical protein
MSSSRAWVVEEVPEAVDVAAAMAVASILALEMVEDRGR